MPHVALATLCLNEMQWLPSLYEQHKDWPGLTTWVFVESADRKYAEANPSAVSRSGLSTDGTSEFLRDLSRRDDRVQYVPAGFSAHDDPAQGKIESRNRYLQFLDECPLSPQFVFVLDADEFYAKVDQERIMARLGEARSKWTGFLFPQRQVWYPPSLQHGEAHVDPFSFEVVGGFWSIPHCRGWRYVHGMRYSKNHNTPSVGLKSLDEQMIRYDLKAPDEPATIHLGWTAALKDRAAKNRYYERRGESVDRKRKWYTESRAAWETWKPGEVLPAGARVVPYSGPIPEVFQSSLRRPK